LEGESFVSLLNDDIRNKDYAISKYLDAVTLIKGTQFYTEFINDSGEAYARMLFDHATDPLELDNLAEKPEQKGNVEQLSIELHDKWGKDFLKEN
jgi:hypothetical protein